MFFAESLGPAITRRTGAALFEHVLVKLSGRGSASLVELHAIVSEFLRAHGMQVSAEDAIQYLAVTGRLARQDVATFRLAA